MKFLLLPAVIVAFILFLILLGAIGLGLAFVIISVLGRLWRLVTRRPRTG